MRVEGAVALVTGAGRGLGREFAGELVRRGAAAVYGAARDAGAVTEPGVSPVALDITDPERVAQAARQCADVSLLVNNAEWALTNGIRVELARHGTLVVAVHAGFIDTDMAAGFDAPKVSAASVVRHDGKPETPEDTGT
jgi:NAD(P)-dependent dehydrogenase (short-subunit alcohol dehydrogenase family)